MIHFYIKNQRLSFYSPVVAADSLNYLSCRFSFDSDDWQELVKWAHFRQGETVYDLELDADDEIKSAAGLNLHDGRIFRGDRAAEAVAAQRLPAGGTEGTRGARIAVLHRCGRTDV